MRKKPSVILINGKRYDAITGQLIGAAKKAGSRLKNPSTTTVIDGFLRNNRTVPLIKKPAVKTSNTTKSRLNQKPAQTVHNRTQRSKTLMRAVVAKPRLPKRDSRNLHTAKARTAAVNPTRLSRALSTTKSTSVRRFGKPSAAMSKAAQHVAAAKKPLQGEVVSQAKPAASPAAAAVQPLPSMVTSVSHQRLERMLDEALIKADAHKKALSGRLGRKGGIWQRLNRLPTWLVVSLTALVLVIAAGLFAWRYIPEASLKLASMRAQIKGSIPDYVPSGFKIAGPIRYDQGALSMTYRSSTDGRSFIITQQASNWDSSSLKANAVPSDAQVQTSQVQGNTVYVYGKDNDAAVVNNGVLTKLKDKANLTSDQVIGILESLL